MILKIDTKLHIT